MRYLMFLMALSFALPASADIFYVNPGEGGKCALSSRAQKKHIKSQATPRDRVNQGVYHYTQYDSKNFAIFIGSLECDPSEWSYECWEREQDVYKVDGNKDCSVKYTQIPFHEVALQRENDPDFKYEPYWVSQGSVISPKYFQTAWDYFKINAQHECDSLNWVKKGQSKVEFYNNSVSTKWFLINKVKEVKIDFSARCYLQD